jgi:hypothetical protein
MIKSMTASAKALTPAMLTDFERKTGRKIPDAYRAFLMQHNGGRPDPSEFRMTSPRGRSEFVAIRCFFGIGMAEDTFDLEYALATFGSRIPARLFPIARDPGGNLVCISTASSDQERVYFWDHEREAGEGEPPSEANLVLLAESLQAFLDKFE